MMMMMTDHDIVWMVMGSRCDSGNDVDVMMIVVIDDVYSDRCDDVDVIVMW